MPQSSPRDGAPRPKKLLDQVRDRIRLKDYSYRKVFADGALEIASFASEGGDKRMTFRVVAITCRILGNGRRSEDAAE